MSAHDMQVYLWQLTAERLDATEAELANALYMRELEDDLAAARDAYVGLAVTEIATLRGELSGAQVG
ncbi:MAG: hypothetical protein QOD69_3471 [Solirubrobacteraceae bacterium]|jgi:hypothetical protein|nr:hypothetical protein [Solirubrobacteraceae bacterium]